MLQKIGGTTGRSDGAKVIRSVVKRLIFPEFMAAISWTGKSTGGKGQKIRFERYANIIGVISSVCITADRNLTEQMVVHDLKYKVIKYAYARSQTPSTSTASSDMTSEVDTTAVSPVSLIEVSTTHFPSNSSLDEAERERNQFQQNTFGNMEQRHTYQQQPAYLPPPAYHPQHTFHQQQPQQQQQQASSQLMYPHTNYQTPYPSSYNDNWRYSAVPTFTNL